MKFQIPSFSVNRFCWLLVSSTLLASLSGCGGSGAISRSEMAKYAISRDSDDDDDEDEDDGVAVPATPATAPVGSAALGSAAAASNLAATQAAAAASPPATTTTPATIASTPAATSTTPPAVAPPAATNPAPAAAATDSNPAQPVATVPAASAVPAIAGIQPIENRKPAQPLTNDEQRKRSAENVQKLTSALVQWIEQRPVVQASNLRDGVGRPGLSWRVAILPVLGYEELYKRFNLKEAWDSPTNKALLQYIPPEFVSPERFDTFTNYQLFVNGTALFSEKEIKHRTEISDAPGIVLMAEVDNEIAVPWTAPYDYDVTEKPLDRGIGHLREDGVFVGWMTGRAALWPKPINVGTLHKALTFEAGDNVNFAAYMDYPPVTVGGSGRPSFGGMRPSTSQTAGTNSIPSGPASTTTSIPRNSTGSPAYGSTRRDLCVARQPMPPRDAILVAQSKMRQTYEAAFERARTPVEFAKLAQQIYKQMTGSTARRRSTSDDDDNSYASAESNMPPAELFVGLRSAFNVSIKGRDPNLAMQLVDEIDQRFEIDREEFESRMFKGFLGKGGSLRTELNKASNLIPLLEMLISKNVAEDDYGAADENLGYGLAAIRHINDRETNYKWKVLKERVEEGKRRFPRVAKHIASLQANPDNPEANHAVGWYLCVVKDNWPQGLEMLAKSQDKSLRALALIEIQRDSGYNRHITLGDGWWDYGQKMKDDALVFEAAMKRSRTWYLSASQGLQDGLDRIRANNRLDAIDRMIGKPVDMITPGARGLSL